MLKDSTCTDRYEMIKEFLPHVVQSIRKDLRKEHLKKDKEFLQNYFGGKNPNKLSVDELTIGYSQLLKQGNEALWDFFSERWLMKHTDIYDYFEDRLTEVNEKFSEIDQLDLPFAESLANGSIEQFGVLDTYLFSVLNSVVFPKSLFDELLIKAKHEACEEPKKKPAHTQSSPEHHERELNKLQTKYEKKLLGFQKKYDRDIGALKKQVAMLQKKLAEKNEK